VHGALANPQFFRVFISLAAVAILVLYILDFSYWKGRWHHMKHYAVMFVAAAVFIGLFLAGKTYPIAPLVLLLGGSILCYWLISHRLYKGEHPSVFLGQARATRLPLQHPLTGLLAQLSVALFWSGVATLAAWLAWWVPTSVRVTHLPAPFQHPSSTLPAPFQHTLTEECHRLPRSQVLFLCPSSSTPLHHPHPPYPLVRLLLLRCPLASPQTRVTRPFNTR
jgi:hypothetical protein